MPSKSNAYKYQVVSNWIQEKIEDGTFKEGEKLTSEIALAEQFGISRLTVRKAIEYLCSEYILYKESGKGTFISPRKRRSIHTNNIAVITTYIDNYVFTSIMRGIESVVTKEGFNLSFGITKYKFSNEARIIKSYIENGIDGFIIESTRSVLPNPNLNLFRLLDDYGIPYVFINGYYRELHEPVYVVTDDRNVGMKAVEHIYSLGHRNIAGIFKMDEIQGLERFAGYSQGLMNHGIEADENHVFWYFTGDESNIFNEPGRTVLLKKLEGCTAVLCFNDSIAYDLIKFLEHHNIRVPDDISIVGVDNSTVSELLQDQITTFEHPTEKLGEEAARRLIYMIKTGKKADSLKMDMKIIVRKSVKEI